VIPLLAAVSGETADAFVQIGAVVVLLAVLARVAGRFGITAIPLYLLAGLAVGEGGAPYLDAGEEFLRLSGEIGVLLLLFALGLEYTADELRHGLRTGTGSGAVDAVANFLPGFAAGLLLGWETTTAVLLGGVTWVSSSGVVSKVLSDLHRLGNRETPSVLNVLVIEDLAMAVYLPIAAALIAGRTALDTTVTVGIALAAVAVILALALGSGARLSALLAGGGNESLLLAVFGLTLLVGGLAEQLQVSSAIGAFLVGLALSGQVQHRAATLVEPLRNLFAPIFFLYFSFGISPQALVDVLVPALVLAIVSAATKMVSGWVAAARAGVGPRGRVRAGTVLIARGEFSIVIASLAVGTVDSSEIGAFVAAYVLITAVLGPMAAKYADHIPIPARPMRPAPA
jgi:monovalent cation:H+ antiporter-2, CPA2 family